MRFRALALLAGLLLLFPAAAIAQSAGDEQYSDPFADESPSSNPPSSSPPAASRPAPTGSSDQLAATPPSASGSQDGSPSSPSSSSSSSTLPRTGFSAWWLALTGALMLVAGLSLRAGLEPLPRPIGAATPATLGRDVRLTARR